MDIGLPTSWQTTNIFVRITDSDLAGQTGVIKAVNVATCSVYLPDEERIVTVGNDNLEPLMPKTSDDAKVLCGSYKDRTGNMVAIDGCDGVIIMPDEKDPILIPLLHLCRTY